MAVGHQRLTVEAETKGFDQAAQDIKRVEDAEGKVVAQQGEATKAAEGAAKAQDRLNASTETYTSLASRLHPTLGALVDGMVKAARVAGDFANQQINLRELTEKFTGAIRANVNALKLMGAAGLVVAGIMAIVHAVRTAREEFERYTAAIKKNQEELNKIKGQEEELEVAITKVAGTRRRVAALMDEQARAATEDAKAIMAQYEAIDRGVVIQTVGMLAGLGLSREQLAKAAFLAESGRLELSPLMGGAYMARRVATVSEREAAWLEETRRRETIAGRGMGDISTTGGVRRPSRRQEAAFLESRAQGATRDLTAMMQDIYPDMTQEDAQRLAEIAAKFGGLQEFRMRTGATFHRGARRIVRLPSPGVFGIGEESVTLDPHEIAEIRTLLERMEHRVTQTQPVTIINQHHPRIYSRSARERAESRTGGEHYRDAMEIG